MSSKPTTTTTNNGSSSSHPDNWAAHVGSKVPKAIPASLIEEEHVILYDDDDFTSRVPTQEEMNHVLETPAQKSESDTDSEDDEDKKPLVKFATLPPKKKKIGKPAAAAKTAADADADMEGDGKDSKTGKDLTPAQLEARERKNALRRLRAEEKRNTDEAIAARAAKAVAKARKDAAREAEKAAKEAEKEARKQARLEQREKKKAEKAAEKAEKAAKRIADAMAKKAIEKKVLEEKSSKPEVVGPKNFKEAKEELTRVLKEVFNLERSNDKWQRKARGRKAAIAELKEQIVELKEQIDELNEHVEDVEEENEAYEELTDVQAKSVSASKDAVHYLTAELALFRQPPPLVTAPTVVLVDEKDASAPLPKGPTTPDPEKHAAAIMAAAAEVAAEVVAAVAPVTAVAPPPPPPPPPIVVEEVTQQPPTIQPTPEPMAEAKVVLPVASSDAAAVAVASEIGAAAAKEVTEAVRNATAEVLPLVVAASVAERATTREADTGASKDSDNADAEEEEDGGEEDAPVAATRRRPTKKRKAAASGSRSTKKRKAVASS